jgi:hypothetical protein
MKIIDRICMGRLVSMLLAFLVTVVRLLVPQSDKKTPRKRLLPRNKKTDE